MCHIILTHTSLVLAIFTRKMLSSHPRNFGIHPLRRNTLEGLLHSFHTQPTDICIGLLKKIAKINSPFEKINCPVYLV